MMMRQTNLCLRTLLAFTAAASFTIGAPLASAAAEALPYHEGSATIVVLPDTQYYSQKYPHYFQAQTKWIAERYKKRNIVYVLHQGDIVQHDAPQEWEVATRCLDMLNGKVPYALALGNHDYHDGQPRGLRETRLNEYFPLAKQKKHTGIAGVFEKGRAENCYHLTMIGEQRWIILALEYGPRDKVLTWANEVLEQYPQRKAILVTHGYLFYNNQRFDYRKGKQRANPHGYAGEGSDGEEMWQKLVRKNKNMMIVICGHLASAYVGYRADEGDYGNTVHQMLVDYQKMRGGGQGYMRLLEFLPDGKTVQVRTFSPATGRVRSPITRGDPPMRDPKLEEFSFVLQGPTRNEPKPVLSEEGKAAIAQDPLRKPPIHRYSFDAIGENSSVPDSVGGAHGTLQPKGTDSRIDGKGNLVLMGSICVSLPPDMLKSEDASFEVWFAPTADSYNWQRAVSFAGGGDAFYYCFRTFRVHRSEIIVNGHNEDIQSKGVPVEKGKMMHVVVTYEQNGVGGNPLLRTYRDGERRGSMQTSLKLTDVEDTNNSIGPFEGIFDEVRVYDYPLTDAEIRGNFHRGPDKLKLK